PVARPPLGAMPDMASVDLPTLWRGLRANYQAARKLANAALCDRADAEKLHRFRRRVKYLHYQLNLLCDLRKSPVVLPAMLKDLGATLGQINDLHELMQAIQQLEAGNSSRLQQDLQAVHRCAAEALSQLLPVFAVHAQLLFTMKPK